MNHNELGTSWSSSLAQNLQRERWTDLLLGQRLEFHPLIHGSCPHKSMRILVSLINSLVIPSDCIF